MQTVISFRCKRRVKQAMWRKRAHGVSFVAPLGAGWMMVSWLNEAKRCPFCLTRSMFDIGMDPHQNQSWDHHSLGRRLVYGCWPSCRGGGGGSEKIEVWWGLARLTSTWNDYTDILQRHSYPRLALSHVSCAALRAREIPWRFVYIPWHLPCRSRSSCRLQIVPKVLSLCLSSSSLLAIAVTHWPIMSWTWHLKQYPIRSLPD